MSALQWSNIDAVPVVHGRLAFALEVRRRLLETRYGAVAVELPPSLGAAVAESLPELPRISVVLARETPRYVDAESPWTYVPVHGADAIVEAVRVAERERVPVAFVDAEVADAHARGVVVPDPHALHGLGLEKYVEVTRPLWGRLPSDLDLVRERHMAKKLAQIARAVEGRVLFVCGLAHWERIRTHLEAGTGALVEDETPPADVRRFLAHPRSIPLLTGEVPYFLARYEVHRAGFSLEEFDPSTAITELFMSARRWLERRDPGTLERPEPGRLRTVIDYLRKLLVRRGQLMPDSYHLALAAKGVVGSEYALSVLELANSYPFNAHVRPDGGLEFGLAEVGESREAIEALFEGMELPSFQGESNGESEDSDDVTETEEERTFLQMTHERALLDGEEVGVFPRLPGTPFEPGRLELERRPERRAQREYERRWNDAVQCSWPPEDIVIENFRDYVGKRALSLARVGQVRTEPFATSFLDGIDIRETLRDVVDRKIHVREEPHVPGAVGALVLIFEEDDFGEKFPWRTTWMAEHANESTLAFYASDFHDEIIGPGIARAHYGGCLLIFPAIAIPDVWDDLRFEQARTPSERLLLAGIYWGRDRYVVQVAKKPPRREVQAEAGRHGKHILHLPISTFGRTTLERLRRVHVLNGRQVRSYAQRFIR